MPSVLSIVTTSDKCSCTHILYPSCRRFNPMPIKCMLLIASYCVGFCRWMWIVIELQARIVSLTEDSVKTGRPLHILLTYEICVLSLVILLLPWLLLYTLFWSQTICLKVRQSVSKLDNLSHTQTICPMQALSCTESDTSHSVILLLPWLLLYTLCRSQTVCLVTESKLHQPHITRVSPTL